MMGSANECCKFCCGGEKRSAGCLVTYTAASRVLHFLRYFAPVKQPDEVYDNKVLALSIVLNPKNYLVCTPEVVF